MEYQPDIKDFDRDELFIIYEGTVEVVIELEGEFEYVIDILSKGSVIRPKHFLVNRLNNIHYRACDRVLLYSLQMETLVLLSL